jgi:ribosomal protein S4
MTRAYHGEQVREKQWQRMFRPHLASVVPMDHRYLAQFDGSEQALGRGSGLDVPPDMAKTRARKTQKTPYMNMVYAPLERRLDTAIFRALFASSARQARQFVVHGFVKVNGKKVKALYHIEPGN